MDPYAFTNTDDGILNAQNALRSLRAILDVDITSDDGNDDSDASMDDIECITQELSGLNKDKNIALREQLDGLEDMLEIATDARLARTLSGPDIEPEIDEESMEILKRVIQIATDIIGSEMADSMSDDDENSSLQDETQHRYVQSNAQATLSYSLEGPLGPLTELSTSDSEEPDPTCIVCGMDLSPADRVKMPCGHIYCPDCTKELVRTYITRPFPNGLFRCCPHPKPSISTQDVDQFISASLRKNLYEKLKEAKTPHDQRIYCPQENCRRFINPERVTPVVKRVGYVKCPNNACRVQICLDCKKLIHIGVDCDTHADNSQATKIQRQFGWSRCPGCRFVVEKIDGCNEILCTRCGCGFTYCTL